MEQTGKQNFWKKSGKSSKKVLTKGERYGIITELSERDGLKNENEAFENLLIGI